MFGLYASYGFSDSSHPAQTLANYLDRLQVGAIRWLSPTRPQRGVDSNLDNRIEWEQQIPFRKWVAGIDTVIWFSVDPHRLQVANRLHKRNILVLSWPKLQAGDLEHLKRFSAIVVPNFKQQAWLAEKANLVGTVIPWDSGLPFRHQSSRVTATRLVADLRTNSIRQHGTQLVHVIQLMMEMYPKLFLSVLCGNSWHPCGNFALDTLLKQHGNRCAVFSRLSAQMRLQLYDHNDWLLWPAVADGNGIVPLEGLACGLPIIGFDIPEANGVIQHKHNGWLIPCGVEETAAGAPFAVPTMRQTITALTQVLESTMLLEDLKGHDWPELERRRHTFQTEWKAILGLL